MKALRDHAVESKWTQGQFDDVMGVIKAFADKGVLQPMFDPAAEAAKLGETAAARRGEAETFANQLKARGELTEGEFGELMSLAPTADGVTLVEKIRKWMGPAGLIQPQVPGDGGGSPEGEAMTEARALRADPRYDRDPAFKKAADNKWIAAWEAGKAG